MDLTGAVAIEAGDFTETLTACEWADGAPITITVGLGNPSFGGALGPGVVPAWLGAARVTRDNKTKSELIHTRNIIMVPYA